MAASRIFALTGLISTTIEFVEYGLGWDRRELVSVFLTGKPDIKHQRFDLPIRNPVQSMPHMA